MKKLIFGLIMIIIIVAVIYSNQLLHLRTIDRIDVELDGVFHTADDAQMVEILNDFNNSIMFSDKGSDPWTCGVDEEIYCVYFYNRNDLIYKFAPVLDGCSSFECCYNAYGRENFYVSCEKAKKIVDMLTGNPYFISRYQ